MATKTLKKNETVIWLPPRAIGERPFATEPQLLAVVHSVEGPRYSKLSLDTLPTVRTATLVLDARDVSLIPVKLPPLSGARLRQALPNAVEDRLLQDPGTCSFGLGPVMSNGYRLVAVTDKAWLEFVVGAIERRGIRVATVLPAQLSLPFEEGVASLACLHNGLAVRTGVHAGMGWGASAEEDFRCEAITTALSTVLAPPVRTMPFDPKNPATGTFGRQEPTLGDGPENDSAAPDTKRVDAATRAQGNPPDGNKKTATPDSATASPPGGHGGYQARRLVAFIEDESWTGPVQLVAARMRLPVSMQPLPIPEAGGINLLSHRGGSSLGRRLADVDWRAWRVPAALALASLLVFLGGLNLHWGKLASESRELRAESVTRFRQTFPQVRAIQDPLLQMQRSVATMRAGAGQSGPNDFLPLMARFGQALGPKANNALTGLEYRDGKLKVTFTPAVVAQRAARDTLQQSCKRLGLNLRFESGKDGKATVTLL